jgi:flavin reductase (DIM6/NTAB) family NADH-FMN oxidoreductase RutF
VSHGNAGFGAKILDDDFLYVPVTPVQIEDGQQRIDAVRHGFADADQQSGGEGNALLPGFLNGAQALGGKLIGGVVVGRAGVQQFPIGGFEHETHAGRNGGKAGDPFGAEQSGIGMRQQGGFAKDEFAHGLEIMECRFVAEMAHRVSHLRKQELGLVSQAEKSLGATEFLSLASHGEHLVRVHGMSAGVAGIATEGAIAAIVATEIGERQEDLAGIGDYSRLEFFLRCPRSRQKRRQFAVRTRDEAKCLIARNAGRGQVLADESGGHEITNSLFLACKLRTSNFRKELSQPLRCIESYMSRPLSQPGDELGWHDNVGSRNSTNAMSLSQADFRKAMGAFATGVSLITVDVDGEVHGMTANALTSVSLEPLLLLVCVDRRARTHAHLHAKKRFGINILEENQRAISEYFARSFQSQSGAEQETGARFDRTAHGTPMLHGALAYLECGLKSTQDAGDHTIFIAEVEEAVVRAGAPLLFFKGNYWKIGVEVEET